MKHKYKIEVEYNDSKDMEYIFTELDILVNAGKMDYKAYVIR